MPLAPFLALTLLSSADAAPDFSDQWSRFVILVWQYRVPPPGPQAKAAYESAGLGGLHLDGGFSQKLLDFALANDYPYYVDHTAGKGDLYLHREAWSKFFAAYKANRKRPVRPNCLRDPAVVARLKEKLKRNVERAKVGPVVAYAFDDEISVTTFGNPADVCWCERCLAAFRAWLKEQYGTVEALNREWDTELASFEEAEPLHVDDLRHFHREPLSRWNLSRWADHRSFMDTSFADTLAELTRCANELDPRTPAGFVGGQAPAAYGGYDYAKLCRAVQWMEAYDLGGTNEILRSFWGQQKPHVQTYFSSFSPTTDKWFLWYYFVHGDRGVICWPAKGNEPWFQDGTARPEIRAMADTYRELEGKLGSLLVGAELETDGLGLYYSHPSIQVSWFMDIEPHGATWINRSSSLNNTNATDILNRWAWLKLLEDCGLQAKFVSYLDVAASQRAAAADKKSHTSRSVEFGLASADPLAGLKVLVLPRCLALSEEEAEAIRTFVENGGTVIADYLPGVFDEHGKARPKGALDGLFGVTRDLSKGVLDGKSLAEVNGEYYQRPLAQRLAHDGAITYQSYLAYERGLRAATAESFDEADGTAVLLQRAVGKGKAVYLNLTPLPYLLCRNTAQGDHYRIPVAGELAEAGVKPRATVTVDGQPDPTVECLLWRKGDEQYLCLVRNVFRDAKIDGMGATGGVSDQVHQVRVELAKPARTITNLRTGQALGPGRTFDDDWRACEANIYRLTATP